MQDHPHLNQYKPEFVLSLIKQLTNRTELRKHKSLGLTENVVEEVTIIIVGFKSLIKGRATLKDPDDTNINRKIQFAIQVKVHDTAKRTPKYLR